MFPEIDGPTRANWGKVAEALEQAGKTDCAMYHRACHITRTGRDPLVRLFPQIAEIGENDQAA